MKLFEGKVALVTGAGGGIGLATASAFAEAGASVIVADSNATLLEEAADGLRSAGHEVLAVTCDVTDRNQVRAMTEQAVGTYGRLDAAFNNATDGPLPAPIIRLRAASEEDVEVESVACDDPAVHCTSAKGPGSMATLRVRIDQKQMAANGVHALLQIRLARPRPE